MFIGLLINYQTSPTKNGLEIRKNNYMLNK